MNNGKATYYVRLALENGVVRYSTSHLPKQLEKRGIDMLDVNAVLSGGKVTRTEWKKDIRVWECKMIGLSADNQEISVGLFLYHEQNMIVITTAFKA
ncbi:MAG: DUF4258 domain-containing protein [Proteobacteria bacterium]|nr:DUF4258 domain-containing protein [Pseudomonadota bacterium]